MHIIYAHEKSFEKEKYGEIKLIFNSISRCEEKVVYRLDAFQFARLKSECADFLELTASSSELAKNMTTMSLSQFMNKALNWQETATSFIDRLSKKYAAYADIIQPVQVAVYEMKLGLSLVLSSALQKLFISLSNIFSFVKCEEFYCEMCGVLSYSYL